MAKQYEVRGVVGSYPKATWHYCSLLAALNAAKQMRDSGIYDEVRLLEEDVTYKEIQFDLVGSPKKGQMTIAETVLN
jgi:hypothetical protein